MTRLVLACQALGGLLHRLLAALFAHWSPALPSPAGVVLTGGLRPPELILRPLEWLNAPLASCPEALRETLGKVAIVTLVNAVAVLAYVLMFRGQ